MTEVTALYVDPDDDARAAACETLAAVDGISTIGRGSLSDAVEALESDAVDCVVTAYSLPDGTGLDLAASVREVAPDTPCILFTDEPAARIETEQHEDVVVEYLPRDMPEAEQALARLIGNVIEDRTQVAYPLPLSEDERLAALSQYDRPGFEAEASFDRLTTIAREFFDVDVAFVGFVDAHEERFLSCQGADWETLDREDSICTHTILEDDVMVVEDVKTDHRFEANDRLEELNIRSYAGASLTTPKGASIGAFCLIDDEPREFSEEDVTHLRRFADEAMEQLELRHRLSENDDDGARPDEPTGDGAAGDGGEAE